jgi:hypothetical protein
MLLRLRRRFGNAAAKSPECWDCRAQLKATSVFCASCRIIQPPIGSQNAFQVFTLPYKFNLSAKLLERQYLALQKQLHPDNFSLKSNVRSHSGTRLTVNSRRNTTLLYVLPR